MTDVTTSPPGATYPPAPADRLLLAAALEQGGGVVCGRLRLHPGGYLLEDGSGSLAFAGSSPAPAGSLVSGRLRYAPSGPCTTLDEVQVLVPARGASPDPGLAARLPALKQRARVIRAIRDFFHSGGFLEIDTPVMVPCPGMEPYLKAYKVEGIRRFLRTSPELHMKRMLAAGAERLFQIAPCFRDDEVSPWHAPGFLMLEWYRAYARPGAIVDDLEGMVVACCEALGAAPDRLLPDVDLTPPWPRATVRELVREKTGLDLATLRERRALRDALVARGLPVGSDPEAEDWDTLFFRLFLTEVEPGLGARRPLILTDYPASQAALARTRDDADFPVAERFELYLGGIELANAFHELNDPAEQRRRHEADRTARRELGAEVYDLDEKFLAALEHGMPPSSGIALGVDRLVAVLTGAPDLASITAFPGE